MEELVKNELEQYRDFLIESGITDLENLKGNRLKRAIKMINRYKKEREIAENTELDRIFLKKIQIFL